MSSRTARVRIALFVTDIATKIWIIQFTYNYALRIGLTFTMLMSHHVLAYLNINILYIMAKMCHKCLHGIISPYLNFNVYIYCMSLHVIKNKSKLKDTYLLFQKRASNSANERWLILFTWPKIWNSLPLETRWRIFLKTYPFLWILNT